MEQSNELENAYVQCLLNSLKFVKLQYHSYLDDEDLSIIDDLLELPTCHLCILSRLSSRKKIWMKTIYFDRYLKYYILLQKKTGNNVIDLNETIHDVIYSKFMDVLSSNFSDIEILRALEDVATIKDLKALAKAFNIKIQG